MRKNKKRKADQRATSHPTPTPMDTQTTTQPLQPAEGGLSTSDLLAVFGEHLPIMAKLPNGFFLVAHKNGPGIANANLLACLEYEDEEIPPHVREAALKNLADWCAKQPTYPAKADLTRPESKPEKAEQPSNEGLSPSVLLGGDFKINHMKNILFVNANPDEGYPLRILQAYLDAEESVTVESNPPMLGEMMNAWSAERVKHLRKSLDRLSSTNT